MDHENSIVYVVDDDKRVREALEALLRSAGRTVRTFGSAVEYLAFRRRDDASSCLILDLDMPEMSGLELQQELSSTDVGLLANYHVVEHLDLLENYDVIEHLDELGPGDRQNNESPS